MGFSFAACGVDRPDTNVCIVNAPGKQIKCYNLARDYTDEGTLKVGAKPTYREIKTLDDINKAFLVDPNSPPNNQGFANLKAYIRTLRERFE